MGGERGGEGGGGAEEVAVKGCRWWWGKVHGVVLVVEGCELS